MNKITAIVIGIALLSCAVIGAALLTRDGYSHSDTTHPSINLISPTNNSFIIPGTVIDLRISDDNLRSAEYWVNDETNEILELPFEIDTTDWMDGVKELKIIAIDTESNTAVAFYTFIIDSVPPTIIVSLSNNSLIRPGDMITLSVSDENIESANHSINGASYQNLISGLNINTQNWADGNYNVQVNAIDKAGNSMAKYYDFILSTQPTITLTIGSPKLMRIVNNESMIYVAGQTEFNISATSGNASEISDFWFRIWNPGHPFLGEGPGVHAQVVFPGFWSEWIQYENNFSFNDPDLPLTFHERYDDLHHIEFLYSDIYGHNSTIQNISIILDKYGPDTLITPYAEENYPKNVNSTTIFNMTATDWTIGSSSPGVGFNSTWYRIWNGSSWTSWIRYTGNFTLTGPAGLYYIEYYSVDDLGNKEATRRADYYFNPD